jgi:hypothetical protein
VYLGNSVLMGRDNHFGPDNSFFGRLKDELIRLSLKQANIKEEAQ